MPEANENSIGGGGYASGTSDLGTMTVTASPWGGTSNPNTIDGSMNANANSGYGIDNSGVSGGVMSMDQSTARRLTEFALKKQSSLKDWARFAWETTKTAAGLLSGGIVGVGLGIYNTFRDDGLVDAFDRAMSEERSTFDAFVKMAEDQGYTREQATEALNALADFDPAFSAIAKVGIDEDGTVSVPEDSIDWADSYYTARREVPDDAIDRATKIATQTELGIGGNSTGATGATGESSRGTGTNPPSATTGVNSSASIPDQVQGLFTGENPQYSIPGMMGDYTSGVQNAYDDYATGAAGITDDWSEFENFYRQKGASLLDRYDDIAGQYDRDMSGIPQLNMKLPGSLGGGSIALAPKNWGNFYGQQAGVRSGLADRQADFLPSMAGIESTGISNRQNLNQTGYANRMGALDMQRFPLDLAINQGDMQQQFKNQMAVTKEAKPDKPSFAQSFFPALAYAGANSGDDIIDSISKWIG